MDDYKTSLGSQTFVTRERENKYGTQHFFLYQYLIMRDAIERNDADCMERAIDDLKGHEIDEVRP